MTAWTPGPPPPSPTRQRGCAATLGVLVLMVAIVGGGFAAAEAVADVPWRPVLVGEGVIIQPLPGWEFVGRSDDRSGVLLSNGAGSLDVTLRAGRPEPAAALAALFDEWRTTIGPQMSAGEIELVDIGRGQLTAHAVYSGPFAGINYPVQGEVTAVQGSGVTVIFDGWAGEGEYPLVRPFVDRMIHEANIP